MQFDVIARAGLTQQEFGALAGVSRVSVNTWVKGKVQPNKFIGSKIAALLGFLEAALGDEALPLQRSVAKVDRAETLKLIVRACFVAAKGA